MRTGSKLSDEQRGVISTALSEGYFAVPRQITLTELSEKVELSDIETSQELRRALSQHLRETLDNPP